MNDVQLIQNRLEVMKGRKAQLLTMKKADRQGKLPLIERTISNLKRWLSELK